MSRARKQRRRSGQAGPDGRFLTEPTVPRFSLVIPAFNEEGFLPRLLDSVDAARAIYAGGRDAVEVIVADNASTDRTAEVAALRGCRVVRADKRAIAAARNAGARQARGAALAFVDADSRIHPETFNVLDAALATGRFVGGATGVMMERWSPGIAVTYAMILPLVWLTRFDAGVVFCLRQDFERVGGYDETRLIAEDLTFLIALRRLGRRRRQRLVRLRSAKAIASTRKFDEFGDWHYFTALAPLALAYAFRPEAAQRLVDRYWYRPNR